MEPQPTPKYDKANLRRAFDATLTGVSVYRAARVYGVPESTLRDRTRHIVSLEAVKGPDRIFTSEEEMELVQHIKYMAEIGYGYTKINIQYMAADFCKSLGKKTPPGEKLSNHWFYGLMGRWSSLKLAKPQKLQIARARSASAEVVTKYFRELGGVLRANNLMDAPERIYNIDETGISTEHTPPRVVCDKNLKPQAVTSARSSNVTIIAGANAIGNNIPPFYVFPGKRWSDDLLKGAPSGSAGRMSDSGWSNTGIFETYVTEHLARHTHISEGKEQPATLILYDGHKSHISLTLTEWAKKRNVILFVLPPHTSHITQPLDVGVFGPFKAYYNTECQTYLHNNPGISISRYEVADLTAKPYIKAVCPANVISAFRKSGIYPFDSHAITPSETAPSTIYITESPQNHPSTPTTCNVPDETQLQDAHIAGIHDNHDPQTGTTQTQDIVMPVQHTPSTETAQTNHIKDLLNAKKITTIVQRPKKRFVTPYAISGNLMNKTNIDSLTLQAKKRKIGKPTTAKKNITNTDKTIIVTPIMPSTSGTVASKISRQLDEDVTDSDVDDGDDEVCCVCGKFQPEELRACIQLIFVKWAQCDVCGHWTHLQFCTPVRVIRRGMMFKCPHCL